MSLIEVRLNDLLSKFDMNKSDLLLDTKIDTEVKKIAMISTLARYPGLPDQFYTDVAHDVSSKFFQKIYKDSDQISYVNPFIQKILDRVCAIRLKYDIYNKESWDATFESVPVEQREMSLVDEIAGQVLYTPELVDFIDDLRHTINTIINQLNNIVFRGKNCTLRYVIIRYAVGDESMLHFLDNHIKSLVVYHGDLIRMRLRGLEC